MKAAILNNHVVYDHRISHDLPHGFGAPCSMGMRNNNLPRLEHTKCMLHILHVCLLLFDKPPIYSSIGSRIVFANVDHSAI
jgi:hypothetical protein